MLKLQSKHGINSHIKKLMNYRDKLFDTMIKTPSPSNRYLYKKFRNRVVPEQCTVQAIRNITSFSCKKFIRIRMNFIRKFMHKIREKFVHEFMPEDYVFKEKIWGKVSVSLISPKIFQCRVLSAWADIEIHCVQYVDIIKGNILIEIILQAVC